MFISNIVIDWDQISHISYLRGIEAIKNLESLKLNNPVTFFVGENGSGKSTLLEAIAVAEGFNPEGGTKNYSFSTFDSHSELCDAIRISRQKKAKWGYFLRAESFYNVATKEAEYSIGGGLHLHERAHGESFMAMVQSTFRGNGLYILDEPEAALSPQRQLTLMLEIDRCRREGAQFIIATHSPVLLALPDAEILSFDDSEIHPCSYEETGAYQITSMFINDRQHILRKLFEG